MKSVDIRNLGSEAPRIEARRTEERDLLVSDDDKPVAVVFAVDAESHAQCMRALDLVRERLAIEGVHREWVELGMEKLALEEINAEIAAHRSESGSA